MNLYRVLLPSVSPMGPLTHCRCSTTLVGCPGIAHGGYHRPKHPGFMLLLLISLAQPLCTEGVGGYMRQWDAGSAVIRLFFFPVMVSKLANC